MKLASNVAGALLGALFLFASVSFFLTRGVGLGNPLLLAICFLAAFLLWSGRKAFAGLLN